jgi:hypothetical protein
MTKMAQRRGTAAEWTTANTVLLAGEIGFETDTGYFKIGDGTTAWTTLLYANPRFDSLSFGVSAPTGFTTSSSSSVSTTGTSTSLSLSSGFGLDTGYSLLNSNSDQTIAGNKNFTGDVSTTGTLAATGTISTQGKRIFIQSGTPASPVAGDVWIWY